MHGHVDAIVDQSSLELDGEDSLGPDGFEGTVGDCVALGGDADDLALGLRIGRRDQSTDRDLRLRECERTASRTDS
jgi:hypothetical protein